MSLAEIYDLPETLPERFNLPLARSKLDRVKLEYDCIDDLSTIDGKITGIDYGFKNRTIKEAKLIAEKRIKKKEIYLETTEWILDHAFLIVPEIEGEKHPEVYEDHDREVGWIIVEGVPQCNKNPNKPAGAIYDNATGLWLKWIGDDELSFWKNVLNYEQRQEKTKSTS